MTEPDIPSAYVRDKRTPPPSREELRARIPGWGIDLDPADRPSYPKLQYAPDATGAHWHFPDRQPGAAGASAGCRPWSLSSFRPRPARRGA